MVVWCWVCSTRLGYMPFQIILSTWTGDLGPSLPSMAATSHYVVAKGVRWEIVRGNRLWEGYRKMTDLSSMSYEPTELPASAEGACKPIGQCSAHSGCNTRVVQALKGSTYTYSLAWRTIVCAAPCPVAYILLRILCSYPGLSGNS
jgi:hypothetical protein